MMIAMKLVVIVQIIAFIRYLQYIYSITLMYQNINAA